MHVKKHQFKKDIDNFIKFYGVVSYFILSTSFAIINFQVV